VQAQGRAGSRVARVVASRDEAKRATERPAGATRATKSVEDADTEDHKPKSGQED
jgi:hypothetical protein